jgi:hypothetical protein
MPSHCGLKILADGSKYFGKGGDDKTEGNVSKLTDSPLLDIYNNSSANQMMGYALTVTAKPDKKKKKEKADGCRWNADGTPDCTVQSERAKDLLIDMTDTGMLDASQSGDDIPKASEIAAREKAKPPITNCEKYLAGLLTNNGYVSTGFDYTRKGANGEAPQYRGDSINYDGTFSQGHLHVFAHVYADFKADSDANFYIPAGGRLIVRKGLGGFSESGASLSSGGDSFVLVQFPNGLGNVKEKVTLFVGHIKNVPAPGTVNRNINTRRLIGTTGGEGGNGRGSNHIHLELLRGLHSSIPPKKDWIPITRICP